MRSLRKCQPGSQREDSLREVEFCSAAPDRRILQVSYGWLRKTVPPPLETDRDAGASVRACAGSEFGDDEVSSPDARAPAPQ